ncbi:MAG: S41 family peptidase [Acidobacteria bacterium]|nr:S41 family peptidase [Acidobacteriota bacterium]
MDTDEEKRPPVGHPAGVGGRLLFVCVSLLFVLGLASGAWLGASDDEPGTDSIYKYITLWEEVLRLIRGSYVEEVGGRGLMAGALDGVTDALDPFSVYVPASAVESYRAAQEIGRRHSGVLVLKDRGTAYVAAVDRGSPADLAGLERADIVAGIGGRSSREMPLWELRRQLAAPAGSELQLELLRRGESIETSLVLAEYDRLPPEFEEVRGVGVLTIPSFDEGTAARVEALLDGYAGDSLLIDLRGVAGGSAEAAYAVAGLFAEGELGSLIDREDRKLETFEGAGGLYSGDIDVLTDRSSQGPAEILTAVLRQTVDADHSGEATFGYAGTLQQIELPNGGGLLETTVAFYTDPEGERLNRRIRVSDENRLSAFSFGDRDDGSDPVLEDALDLLLLIQEAPAEPDQP